MPPVRGRAQGTRSPPLLVGVWLRLAAFKSYYYYYDYDYDY